jgi:hypothetical protein
VEVLAALLVLQAGAVLLALFAGGLGGVTRHGGARSLAFTLLLVAFLVSFVVAGVHLTFIEVSATAFIGPVVVAVVLAFSLWRMKANSRVSDGGRTNET